MSVQRGEKRLVTLVFTPEAHKLFRSLKRRSRSKTDADLVRRALHVLDWLTVKTQNGFKVELVKKPRAKKSSK